MYIYVYMNIYLPLCNSLSLASSRPFSRFFIVLCFLLLTRALSFFLSLSRSLSRARALSLSLSRPRARALSQTI